MRCQVIRSRYFKIPYTKPRRMAQQGQETSFIITSFCSLRKHQRPQMAHDEKSVGNWQLLYLQILFIHISFSRALRQ